MSVQGKISCLSSWTKPEEIRAYCEEARRYGYQYVTVTPFYAPLAKAYLKGSPVKVNALIDYPLGQSSAKSKAYAAADAVKRGADFLTIFPNLSAIKMGDLTFLKGECSFVRGAVPHTQIIYLMSSSFSPEEVTSIRSLLRSFSIGLDFTGEMVDPIPTKAALPSSNNVPAVASLPLASQEQRKSNSPSIVPNETKPVTKKEAKPIKKKRHGFRNFFWVLFFGLGYSFYAALAGVLCCVSLIFIPIGLQWFKFMNLSFLPFDKEVQTSNKGGSTFLNVIWIIIGGWENALACFFLGILCYCSLIFIPFAKQFFKFAHFVIMPIGAKIVDKNAIGAAN